MAGEFDDSALLKTFGASGIGVFPAPDFSSRRTDVAVCRQASQALPFGTLLRDRRTEEDSASTSAALIAGSKLRIIAHRFTMGERRNHAVSIILL